ncbi:MAG: hypothetical protein FGF50_11555 [Candidatus Brockarchaeota archaeon]|nr:hypothetical protein [Candidatus Brockarchaeota archaeon]
MTEEEFLEKLKEYLLSRYNKEEIVKERGLARLVLKEMSDTNLLRGLGGLDGA